MTQTKTLFKNSNAKLIQVIVYVLFAVYITLRIFLFEFDIIFIAIFLLLAILVGFFYKSQEVRVTNNRIESGYTKGYRSTFTSIESIELTTIKEISIQQNEAHYFDIFALGDPNEELFICSFPNRIPAEKKTKEIESKIIQANA